MIKYCSLAQDADLFFPPNLQVAVTTLANTFNSADVSIEVYPDALYEGWGLPTGLNIILPRAQGFMLPTFLRDVGCGFLLFKIASQTLPQDWGKVGQALHQLVNERKTTKVPDIKTILTQGLTCFDVAEEHFLHIAFEVKEQELQMERELMRLLAENLYTLSNTIEIRRVQGPMQRFGIQDGDVLGYIHTGSGIFRKIIEDKFAYLEAEQCLQQGYFPADAIKMGVYGIPLNSKVGALHYKWLCAAMNYALVNRYIIFLTVKKMLAEKFACEVSLLNDRIHCGILAEDVNNDPSMRLFRGVQNIYAGDDLHAVTWLAGHRESIALLVTGKHSATIAHGTNNNIRQQSYHKLFSKLEQKKYYNLARNMYANSKCEMSHCLPYTYNLLAAADYFVQQGTMQVMAVLEPLVNIRATSYDV